MSRRSRTLSAVLALTALVALATTPTLAKMGAEAKLDTTISRDAEPGSTIKVGWSVFSEYDGSAYPLDGSPVFIRLVSPDGLGVSEVMGTESPSGSGHYTASIVVPTGGIGEVIVGLSGEACVTGEGCQRSDLIFPLTDDPLVRGAAPMADPTSTTPIGMQLAQLVAIGAAVAVAGALAVLLIDRRRTLGTDAAGR
jgi:hypothetical protein